MIEFDNGPLDYFSRRMKFTPTSSRDAELGAMFQTAKPLIFTANMLEDMGFKVDAPIVMVTDSKSGLETITNAGATKNSIHLDRWMHYLRELYMKGKIKPVLTTTEFMRADMMTKVVDRKKFLYCRKMIMNLRE